MDNHESGYNYSYMPRTIENNIQEVVLKNADIPMVEYWKAIGYLSMWAADSSKYKHVAIFHDRYNGDLIANYYTSADAVGKERPTYQIGAIWSNTDQEYDFHS